MRGWRADGRVMQAKSHLLAKVWRLSARHRGVLRRRAALPATCLAPPSALPTRPLLGSRAFKPRADRAARPSASSSRRVIVPAGGAPAPPEGRRSVRLLPAGAASDPANITLHESALGGSDARMIRPPQRARISSHAIVIIVLGHIKVTRKANQTPARALNRRSDLDKLGGRHDNPRASRPI